MRRSRLVRLAAAGLMLGLAAGSVEAEPLAKNLFGAKELPAAATPASYGFYSKGCFSGGVALPTDGPHWQVMRLSRNRRWGHPDLIRLIENLSRDAAADGWPGLLVGDISQPRGGPMVTGHASHQVGLDVDIWYAPMPAKRLSVAERERVSATSLLKPHSLQVDDRKWSPLYAALLKDAASYRQVERIFVHPGIKKKLCDTVSGDRSWLRKLRPYWGHDDHFHLRIACPKGSTACKPQAAPPRGDGCDESLAWWFTEEPWKPAKGPKKPPARDVMTLADLPSACRAVLAAPSPPSAEAVTLYEGADVPSLAFAAPDAKQIADPAAMLLSLEPMEIPLPSPRPYR